LTNDNNLTEYFDLSKLQMGNNFVCDEKIEH